MVLRKLDIHTHKNEVEPLPHTKHKVGLKWIIDLNIRVKSIQFPKENIGENICVFRLSNGLLEMTVKAQRMKEKYI